MALLAPEAWPACWAVTEERIALAEGANMNGRLPRRSENTPARGATTIVAPVHTSSFSPACRGVLPSTFCMYWERKKIEPNMPKYMLSEATLVTRGHVVDRKSTRLNSSHLGISYAVFC